MLDSLSQPIVRQPIQNRLKVKKCSQRQRKSSYFPNDLRNFNPVFRKNVS